MDIFFGSVEFFIFNWYKEEFGKFFFKLYFWLCSIRDMDNFNVDFDFDSSELGLFFFINMGIIVKEL